MRLRLVRAVHMNGESTAVPQRESINEETRNERDSSCGKFGAAVARSKQKF